MLKSAPGYVMQLELLAVLDVLDAKEGEAQHDRQQERRSPGRTCLRTSAHHTPIAMVKLELISTPVLMVPDQMFRVLLPATKAG